MSKDVEEESAEEKWKDGVIPAVARAAIEEELSKLEALEKNSAEFNVTRNYLDWLTGLPWGSVSGEVFDVAAAKEALDDVRLSCRQKMTAGHPDLRPGYPWHDGVILRPSRRVDRIAVDGWRRDAVGPHGMDDVKERILELVAVGSLVGGVRGKILCLVRAARERARPALGVAASPRRSGGSSTGSASVVWGTWRRSRVIEEHMWGPCPGKPIQCLKATKKFNPVVLIDEVDKLGRGGNSGDPASALLELLDPSQNANFLDHYLDVPVDLSRCLFVCTANDASLIPGPLLAARWRS